MTELSYPVSPARATSGIPYYLRVLRVVGVIEFKAKDAGAALGLLVSRHCVSGRPRQSIGLRGLAPKPVLQSLPRASAQEPLIFIDPGAAWSERRTRSAWLRGRRSARLEGIQQFYSSRRLEVATRRIKDALRLE